MIPTPTLQAWKEAADKATRADADGQPLIAATGRMHMVGPPVEGANYDARCAQIRADAALWNLARTAVPECIAECERLRADAETAWANEAATSELLGEMTAERDDLRDKLRVTEGMVEALGDVNVAHVERDEARADRDRLRALLREACEIAQTFDDFRDEDTGAQFTNERERLAELRVLAGGG